MYVWRKDEVKSAWWFVCNPEIGGTLEWLLTEFFAGKRCTTSGLGTGRAGPARGDILLCYLTEPSYTLVATAVALGRDRTQENVALRLRSLLRIPLGWPQITRSKNLSRLRRRKNRPALTKLYPKEFSQLKRIILKLNPNAVF